MKAARRESLKRALVVAGCVALAVAWVVGLVATVSADYWLDGRPGWQTAAAVLSFFWPALVPLGWLGAIGLRAALFWVREPLRDARRAAGRTDLRDADRKGWHR